MSRNRIIYQNEAVYVGPSNPTGANESILDGYNILQDISLVQGVNYGININRQDIAMLGRRGTVANPIITQPSVEFSLSYYFKDFYNEKKLGFDVNYRTGDVNFVNDTFSLFLFSGFSSNEDRKWDKRNFYIAVSDQGEDIYDNYSLDIDESLSGIINEKSVNYDVFTFHDCYLKAYSFNASVGEIPRVDLDYVSEFISFSSSGSGVDIGTFDSKTRSFAKTGINYVIPKFTRPSGPSVILPGDIQINISETSGTSLLTGLGCDISDIKIQSLSISVDLDRDQLNSITHKGVIDRPIKFPLAANIEIGAIAANLSSGNSLDLIKEDEYYDIDVNLYARELCATSSYIDSAYFVRKALLQNAFYGLEIGQNKTVNLSFRTELDPDDLSYGLFCSGQIYATGVNALLLNTSSGVLTPLLTEDGLNLLLENGTNVIYIES